MAVKTFFQSIGRVFAADIFDRPRSAVVVPIVVAATLGGCAIHPVQQDVTGLPTKQIVDRIRCEARLAVVDKAISLLRAAADEKERTIAQSPAKALELAYDAKKLRQAADQLVPQRGGSINLKQIILPAEAADFYNRYINTVIAYDFSFNITEKNNVDATVDPIRLISGGVVGGGLGATNDRSRQNIRAFKLSDNFRELLSNQDLDCEGINYFVGDFVYPITGSIGLHDIIHNFIDLNEDRPLVAASAGASSFSDAIEFNTTISASAKPSLQLESVGSRIGFAAPTNIGFSAERSDIHKVTIGLAIGDRGDIPRIASLGGVPLRVQILRGETRSSATNRVRAFKAIEDQRINNFFDRAGALLR